MANSNDIEYVGFWPRVWASVIDTIFITLLTAPVASIYTYGTTIRRLGDFLISLVLPAVVVILFWSAKHATPGKMAIAAKIVDARSGGSPGPQQHLIRYVGYFVSILPACLGLLWVAFDSRKQGWHDKLAGTVVVRATDHD
jgi:uncharacterized RDD family membrane protein YckC